MITDSPKLCECGCGRPAPICTQTNNAIGHIKGQPLRFIRGHRPNTGLRVTKTCANCGTQFEVLPTAKLGIKYCSIACYRKGRWPQGAKTKPPRVHNFERVELVCATCGKTFLVAPSVAALGKKYCNRRCYAVAQSDVSNFWKQVDKTDTCWLWTGWLDKDGYGKYASGRAHRYAYEITCGPIPRGMMILHKCDVRNCVRPDHLWIGDNKANMADMVAKGRQSRAPKHIGPREKPPGRLDPDKVRRIRALTAEGYSTYQLAREFGVSAGAIRHVVAGITWAHVI